MSTVNDSTVTAPDGTFYASNPDLWIGPVLLANLIGCMLLGIALVQVINFNVAFKGAHPLRRIGVTIMVAFLAWQQTQRAYVLYEELSTNFGNWTYFGTSQQLVVNISAGWTTAAVVFLVQVFYVDRCYRLNGRNKWVAIGLGVPVFLTLFFGIATSAVSIQTSTIVGQGVPITTVIAFSNGLLGCSLATDLIISLALAATLFKMRTGWSETDSVINQLIRVTLESALLPAIHAICLFVLADHFGKHRDSFIYQIFAFTGAGVNCVTCLQALLIKTRIRGQLSGHTDSEGRKTSGANTSGNRNTRANVYPTLGQNKSNNFELRSTGASRGQTLSHGGIRIETDVVVYGEDAASDAADVDGDWESGKDAVSTTNLAKGKTNSSMV